MSRLPRAAVAYLVAVCFCGLAAIVLSQTLNFPPSPAGPWEMLAFITLGLLAGSKKVRLSRRVENEEAGSMSLGFAITFAALLRFGPGPAVLTACASCLSSCLLTNRQPLHQLAFNVSLSAIEALTGGFVFLGLNGWTLQMRPVETFTAVTGTSLVFYGVNTVGVAIIIALCTKAKMIEVWKENFLWTAPSYIASASVSALALMLFKSSAAAVLLFVLPVAYLVYQSYVTYIGRAEEKQQHIEQLQLNQAQLAELYLATIKSLALAIDAKDQYTHQHILRVQRYAVAIAEDMGLTGSELQAVSTGALLHDIGKLGVPEYVLLKPGRLTPEEFDKMKKHPEIGAAILDPVEFPWPVLPVVRHHHEKWDGTGYPDGLKGENIPLSARIMAVADVYDAVTSTRSYRKAWTHEKAIEMITKDAGTHFDPVVVQSFLSVIDGVLRQMAEEGEGPLTATSAPLKVDDSKSAQAAKDISRASTELWALYEVAQTLSSSLGIEDTISILSRKIESIFPGIGCVFMLKDPKSGALRVGSASGLNREYFQAAHTISESSLSLRVLGEGKTYLGEYDADDLMLASEVTAPWTELRCCMVVAIVCEGQALGTINLYHSESNSFGQYEMQLLEMIAERTAPALFNGLLFDRTKGDAVKDALTGVYNVRYLTECVDSMCKQYGKSVIGGNSFALLCLDLDSFKPINDNFGHQKGDVVLRDLAGIFSEIVGSQGTVSRYGGDEFVIVLVGADQAGARSMARELERAVERYDPELVHYKLGQLRIGVSIGTACFPEDGRDCTSLIAAADSDMYRLKTERKLQVLAQRRKSKRTGEAA